MDWTEIKNKVSKSSTTNLLDVSENITDSALHALAPDNYEYYMCSLELLDCDKKQRGFISFVVMPNNISESYSPIQSQMKTKAGIVTMFNDSFVPVNISLQGTFGRRFRIVSDIVNPNDEINSKWSNFFNGNIGKIATTQSSYKSGYGLIKVLKYILEKANKLDPLGRPYILLYNNYAFNTSYVVDVVNVNFNQSIENNRLWFYELSLKGIADGNSFTTSTISNAKLLKSVSANNIAQGLSNIIKDVKRNNNLTYV